MTKLRKDTPGGAAGLEWSGPDDVVEVDRDVAAQLLAIPDADFHEVLDGDTEPTEPALPEPGGITPPPGDDVRTETDGGDEERLPLGDGTHEHSYDLPTALPGGPVPVSLPPLPTTKPELIALAEQLGIDSSGTVKELTARIQAHIDALAAADDGTLDDTAPGHEPEPVTEPTEPAEPPAEIEQPPPGDDDLPRTEPVTEPDPDANQQ